MNVRALFGIVIDGDKPDGSPASKDEVMAALALCLEHDRPLCELFHVAKFGSRIDGTAVEWAERDTALEELTKLAATPAERPVGRKVVDLAEDLSEAMSTRERRRTAADHHLLQGPALRRKPDRKRLAVDVAARARELGYDPDSLFRPFAVGRPSWDEGARRDELAALIWRLRGEGLRLDEIGEAVGISKQRVSDLSARGRKIVGRSTG